MLNKIKLQTTSTFKKKKQLPLILLIVAVVALYSPLMVAIASFSAETSYIPEQKQIILEHDLQPIATFSDIESLNVITVTK